MFGNRLVAFIKLALGLHAVGNSRLRLFCQSTNRDVGRHLFRGKVPVLRFLTARRRYRGRTALDYLLRCKFVNSLDESTARRAQAFSNPKFLRRRHMAC